MKKLKQVTHPRRGKLVVFEGIDGSGKTTCLDRLLATLDMMAIPHTKIDMIPPGRIRELLLWDHSFTPKQRLLLYKVEGDRARTRALDALKERQLVFCDRAQFSQMAYQGYGDDLAADIWTLGTMFESFPMPDKVVLFDLPVEVALERIVSKRKVMDNVEQKPLDYHQRVRQGFLDQLEGSQLTCLVDATKPADAVFDQVLFEVLSVWDSTTPAPIVPPSFDSSLQ